MSIFDPELFDRAKRVPDKAAKIEKESAFQVWIRAEKYNDVALDVGRLCDNVGKNGRRDSLVCGCCPNEQRNNMSQHIVAAPTRGDGHDTEDEHLSAVGLLR